MRLAAITPSITLLLLLLLVPTVVVSSDPEYCEFTNGELAMTAVSLDKEYPEFANGESVITAVSSDQEYPEFINGLPVIFVETSENTCWLDSNEVVLVILDDSNSIGGSIAKIDDYLSNHQLPEGWSIDVIGGPGASAEEFLRIHNSNNEAFKERGPIKYGGPIKLGGPIQLSTSSENS
jgi:hypothetical protein